MARRSKLFLLIALIAAVSAYADRTAQTIPSFSIRYHDKNIYYPGDEIELKLTLSNPSDSGESDMTFYLADDARQSFGFDLRSLTGEPTPLADGFAAALNDRGAYRVIHLAPGQELSITVPLNRWANLAAPGQYRLTGFFYPRLRGSGTTASRADSVLDLTVMPDTERRWQDEMDRSVREALIRRDIDPWLVVSETLSNRKSAKYNRAMLYLDTESLASVIPTVGGAAQLERSLLEGSWNEIPGFEHPVESYELMASQVYPSEATVLIRAAYRPYGELFSRDLRFYLHKVSGYWSIRRVETVNEEGVDPSRYGALDLNPPEVVSELLEAVKRGDWDIALRYYDTTAIVRSLPEYIDVWKNMSAGEHRRALDEYRNQLISGKTDSEREPLGDIDDWSVKQVSYTEEEGTVVVENITTHATASGPMRQKTIYTFRLVRDDDDQWIVVRYDTVIRR